MMELTRLENGLTVVTDRMEHVDSIALGVWVEAGSRSEQSQEHGVAHFLEHMAFKGTCSRTARQISEAIEGVGGEINAATSYESTAYHVRLLAEDLPLGLSILADILTEPLFAPDDVGRERNVILQEIGASQDVPEDRAFDAFAETAFAGDPLGRRILGTRQSVSAIDTNLLRGFFERHYRSGAMMVACAGAVSHDAFVGAVAEAFSGIRTSKGPPEAVARYTGGAFGEPSEAAECQWILGFEGVSSRTADATTAQLAAMVLGGGMSSRLFQALREDRGLVYDTSAFHWAFRDAGLFGIHFATEAESVLEAAAVVAAELKNISGELDEQEFARSRSQLKAGLLMSRENCASRMAQSARNAILFGRPVTKEERIAELEAVAPSDVCAFIESVTASAPTLVCIGADPQPSLELLSAQLPRAALRGAA